MYLYIEVIGTNILINTKDKKVELTVLIAVLYGFFRG